MDRKQEDLYQRYFPGKKLKLKIPSWFPSEKISELSKAQKIGGIIGIVLLGNLLLAFIFYLSVLWGLFGKIPSAKELANIQNYTASKVYASDGEIIGKYYIENRTNIAYEDISSKLIEALIATEDARFYEHAGVDTRSMMRVMFKSILLGDKSSGGGSTISQQLAKNLYPRRSYSILTMPVNKIREMIIARRLEKVYSKEEIITLYLNTVPFGEGVFGIDVATQRFFSTTPKDIRLENAAVLVGMLKATTAYNPRNHTERAQERRNVVLDQMARNEYIDEETADSLKAIELELVYKNVTREDGLAPYFMQETSLELKKWFQENPGPDGKIYNLYTDGLKIHTTIDSRLQQYAEAAVKTHLKKLQKDFDKHWKNRELWDTSDPGIVRAMKQSDRYRNLQNAGKTEEQILENFNTPVKMKVWSWDGEEEREMTPMDSLVYYQSFLQAGFLAMEPKTGYIRAWVGGGNFQKFKYDHVTSNRQVGSTFKPIIYAAAIENGMDPCEYFPNEKVVYEEYKNWAPGNADGNYTGWYSMKGGLTKSVNTVSAAVMMKVGVDKAVDFANGFRFSQKLPADPSLVLGTADLSLMDMVGAYSAFANSGKRALPVFINRIEDSKGNVIAEFPLQQPDNFQVMDAATANLMARMLESVVDSGTARRLRYTYGLRGTIGGKTGTTQNHTDGWFMGITPDLVAGAWVGGEDRKVRFRSISLGQGANTALPIYGLFMSEYYKDKRFRKNINHSFPSPGLSASKALDCELYTENDPNTTDLLELIKMLRQRQEDRRQWQEERREDELREKMERKRERQDRWDQLFNRKKRRRY